MIIVPDPDARSTDRYRLDVGFRAAADEAHSRAQQFNTTLQLLRLPCDFEPEPIDVNDIHLAHAFGREVFDY